MRLKEYLNYDKITGHITWAINLNYGRKKGNLAGSISRRIPNSFRYIKINQKRYIASRLAFYLTNGKWPKGRITYKDGNTLNNSWNNLIEGSA